MFGRSSQLFWIRKPLAMDLRWLKEVICLLFVCRGKAVKSDCLGWVSDAEKNKQNASQTWSNNSKITLVLAYGIYFEGGPYFLDIVALSRLPTQKTPATQKT